MAPKRNAREPTPSSTATTQTSSTGASSVPAIPTKASIKASNNQTPQEIALGIWQNYLDTTPQRTKLIDVFMGFLMVVGALQFVYCVIAGNYVCALDGGLEEGIVLT
jgi:oligosaccharyltransferase complex subunit epsilon